MEISFGREQIVLASRASVYTGKSRGRRSCRKTAASTTSKIPLISSVKLSLGVPHRGITGERRLGMGTELLVVGSANPCIFASSLRVGGGDGFAERI